MDLRAKLTFNRLQLPNKDEATRRLATSLIKEQIKLAIVEGIKAMVKRIPVATGMSIASLLPVARYAQAEGLIRSEMSKAPRPGRRDRTKEGEALGRPKNPAHAVILRGDEILINFGTNVPHFVFNDLVSRNYPRGQVSTPWGAFAAGEAAILESLGRTIRPKLIDTLDDFLRRR